MLVSIEVLLPMLDQIRCDGVAAALSEDGEEAVEMLCGRRRPVGRCSRHVYRTAADETQLVVLPLQRRTEDVRPALGVSANSTATSWLYLSKIIVTVTVRSRLEDEKREEDNDDNGRTDGTEIRKRRRRNGDDDGAGGDDDMTILMTIMTQSALGVSVIRYNRHTLHSDAVWSSSSSSSSSTCQLAS